MERKYLTLSEGRIAYVAEGQGPALILLHCHSQSADSWHMVIGSLAQRYSVYALDMMGHGYSDKPPRNYLIEDYAKSTVEFMDKLGLEKVALCGNSIGGIIAVAMTANNPERVEKLILVGLTANDTWRRQERLFARANRYEPDGTPRPRALEDLLYLHKTNDLLEWINKQQDLAGIWTFKASIAVALYDIVADVPRIKCPTLILYGEKDNAREGEQYLLKTIKGSKPAIVDNAQHVPQMEQPDAFLKEVNKFLSSH